MGRSQLDVDIENANNIRMDPCFDTITGGIGRLRADSVSLSLQRLIGKKEINNLNNIGGAASKFQAASLAHQGSPRRGGPFGGCIWWFRRNGGLDANGNNRGAGWPTKQQSFAISTASSTSSPSSRRLRITRSSSIRYRSGSDSDSGEDERPVRQALALTLRSFRSYVAGWGSLARLRILGGRRIVMLDGQACSLRTHLRANKPKRSALRFPVPPPASSPDSTGTHDALPASSPPDSSITLPTLVPSKKKLRFASDVRGSSHDSFRSETGSVAGSEETVSKRNPLEQRIETNNGSDGDGSGSSSGGLGGAEQNLYVRDRIQVDSFEISPMQCAAAAAADNDDDDDRACESTAASETSPARSATYAAATAASAAGLSGGTGMAAVAAVNGWTSSSITDLQRTNAAAAAPPTPSSGSLSHAGGTACAAVRQISRKPMIRSPQGCSRVHPQSDALANSISAAAAAPVEGGSQQPEAADAAAVLEPPPPLSTPPTPLEATRECGHVGSGALAPAGSRTSSFLSRLLLGPRDAGATVMSSRIVQQRHPVAISSGGGGGSELEGNGGVLIDDNVAAGNTVAAGGGVGAKHPPPLSPPPPPPPGKHMSARILRKTQTVADRLLERSSPHVSNGVDGGGDGGGDGDENFIQVQRASSYTAPGMITDDRTYSRPLPPRSVVYGGGSGGNGSSALLGLITAAADAAASQLEIWSPSQAPPRRQFLAGPPHVRGLPYRHQESLQHMQQNRLRLRLTLRPAVGEEIEPNDDEPVVDVAGQEMPQGQLTLRDQSRGVGPGEGEGEGKSNAAPKWGITSVRPVGDDVGDEESFDGGGADVSRRNSRSLRGRWTVTATESGHHAGGDGSGGGGGDDGDGDDPDVANTDELPQRLGRGNSLPQVAVHGGGPPDNSACAVDIVANDLSFTVPHAVQEVQDSTAARGRGQPHLNKQVSDRAGQRSDTAMAVKTAAAAAARSRQIRVAPFTAAPELIKLVPSVSAPVPRSAPTSALTSAPAVSTPPNSRIRSLISNRSGSSRWRQQQQQQQQGQAPPFEPIYRSAASFSSTNAASATLPTGANTVTNKDRTSSIAGSEISAAQPPNLAAISSPSQQSSEQPSPSPPVPAAAVGTTAAKPPTKLRIRSSMLSSSNLLHTCETSDELDDDEDCGGGGRFGGGGVVKPPTPLVLETLDLDLEEQLRPMSGIISGGGGGGAAAASHFRVPMTPQATLRPSASSRSRSSIYSRNGDCSVMVTSPSLPGPSAGEFVLSPLNTPTKDGL
ncbi:hypothetical protein VaNZ11_015747 [Volvox africanus]|uniref:Uncharacterized protein n=1 Tax=Volvox africanus TaxID=51714 RepID=A0ABQ5SMR7_9CHLO|nr:hypothetical protein VaNZ11_015747 [Volvox africanus]